MLQSVSRQTLQRLPDYLNCLHSLLQSGMVTVSAKTVAEVLGLGEIQVRKDLASVSTGGRPKIGYILTDLIKDLEIYLGYNDSHDAVLVGAGKLGRALLSYNGFKEYGLNIVAAFDTSVIGIAAIGTAVIGTAVIGTAAIGTGSMEPVRILSVDKLPDVCRSLQIRIGIITVPSARAQEVCDQMVENGILAIWNFAPTHLRVPENILVKNENMAASLAVLSQHLSKKLLEDHSENRSEDTCNAEIYGV